jgi:anti-anti-sigma regulatory factor/HAMP domain-containing protein
MFSQIRTRLLLSSVLIIAIVVGSIAFVLIERNDLNRYIDEATQLTTAAGRARELSLYVQYSAYDASAYSLGHLEFRPEYAKHSALFDQVLAELQRMGKDGLLGMEADEELEGIKETRTAYSRAAQQLFVAANANRNLPSPENQALQTVAWDQTRMMADRIDKATQGLADRINQVAQERQRLIAERNQQLVNWAFLVAGLIVALIVLIQVLVARTVGAPLRNLTESVRRFAAGDFGTRVDVQRRDEVGALATAFNTMAATIQQQQGSLVRLELVEAARAEAEAARIQLASQLATIEEQRAVIRELSIPVIPIDARTIVLPLVGALDTARLRQVQGRALRAIERSSASYLVLDITGVPVIDSQVAQGILRVVQATQLLGAKVVLVGIRPEVAQAVVGLGLELEGLVAYRDLQSALGSMAGRRNSN